MNRAGCKFMSSSRAEVNASAVKVSDIISSVRWSSLSTLPRDRLTGQSSDDNRAWRIEYIFNWWKSQRFKLLYGRESCFFCEKMTLVYLIFWLKMLRFTHIRKKRKFLDFTLYVHFQDEAIFSIFRGYISTGNDVDDQYDKYSGSNHDNCYTAERMLRLFLQNSSEWNWRRPILLGRKSSKFKFISLRKMFAFEPFKRWCKNVQQHHRRVLLFIPAHNEKRGNRQPRNSTRKKGKENRAFYWRIS